jgi:hypothetical protein
MNIKLISTLLIFTCCFFHFLSLEAKPLFPNSVASNDLDFISTNDQSHTYKLTFIEQTSLEIPSVLNNQDEELIQPNAYRFAVEYEDQVYLEIHMDPKFKTISVAKEYANKVVIAQSHLPKYLREKIEHIVIIKGDAAATAEPEAGFFILYSDNIDTRIKNHDLEETIFHESIHVNYENFYTNSRAWKSAQKKDNWFITDYAQNSPIQEDFPETAIFTYTLINYPGRLSKEIEHKIKTNMPARLEFFKKVFQKHTPTSSKN